MNKTFAYVKPSAQSLGRIRSLRDVFAYVQTQVEGFAPASRERSVALTHLETAAMWAIKAITHNDPEAQIGE